MFRLAWIGVLSLLPAFQVEAQVRPGVRAAKQIVQAQRKADAQLERLRLMTPQQRERVLSLMAPERRRRMESRLAAVDQMNDDQRAKLERRLQSFRELPPQDRQNMRALAQQLNQMEQPRRRIVRQELLRLREMNDADRQSRLESDGFRSLYSPEERDLLSKLSALPLPEE